MEGGRLNYMKLTEPERTIESVRFYLLAESLPQDSAYLIFLPRSSFTISASVRVPEAGDSAEKKKHCTRHYAKPLLAVPF
jgi:hypothetical protein